MKPKEEQPSAAEIALIERKKKLVKFFNSLSSTRDRNQVRITVHSVHPRFTENRWHSYIYMEGHELNAIVNDLRESVEKQIQEINKQIQNLKE